MLLERPCRDGHLRLRCGKATSSWHSAKRWSAYRPREQRQCWSTIRQWPSLSPQPDQPRQPVVHDRWRWQYPPYPGSPMRRHPSHSTAIVIHLDTAGVLLYPSQNDRPCWSASPYKRQLPTGVHSPSSGAIPILYKRLSDTCSQLYGLS